MANKLTTENIEAAVQHLENIQSGVTPILDGVDRTETPEDDRIDLGNQTFEGHQQKKSLEIYPLIPPNDPRLLMQIAPFMDDTLEHFGFEDRKSLSKVMHGNMVKYGGLVYQQIKLDYHFVCLLWEDTHRLKKVKSDMFLIHSSMM